MNKDNIYSNPIKAVPKFVFDDSVVNVFPDMLKRSVPGYPTTIAMIQTLASQIITSNSNVYDLGCSLGAAIQSIFQAPNLPAFNMVGVDNSQAMIDQCHINLKKYQNQYSTKLICEDLLSVPFENTSLCILNFTLQFLPIEKRLSLLTRIHESMLPKGAMILSEKITFENEALNERQIRLHHNFKKANGYSDLEISQKRSAIEEVLIPETITSHQNRFQQAGFSHCDLWFQCFNFVSFIAYK